MLNSLWPLLVDWEATRREQKTLNLLLVPNKPGRGSRCAHRRGKGSFRSLRPGGKGKQKLNELDERKRLACVGARSLRMKKQRSIARGSQKRDDREALLKVRERGRRRSELERQASDRDLARSCCPGPAEAGEGLLEDALERGKEDERRRLCQ